MNKILKIYHKILLFTAFHNASRCLQAQHFRSVLHMSHYSSTELHRHSKTDGSRATRTDIFKASISAADIFGRDTLLRSKHIFVETTERNGRRVSPTKRPVVLLSLNSLLSRKRDPGTNLNSRKSF